MSENKSRFLKKQSGLLLAAVVIWAVLFLFGLDCFAEQPKTILAADIQVNGRIISLANYTAEDLSSMPQTRQIYSSLTAYGAPSLIAAQGISLEDFLQRLGISGDDVSEAVLSSADGVRKAYAGAEYLGRSRYLYPEIFSGGKAKEVAVPMLALAKYEQREAGEADFSRIISAEGIVFCFGQKEITDPVSVEYGKYINKITFVLKEGIAYDLPENTFGSGTPGSGHASPAEEPANLEGVDPSGTAETDLPGPGGDEAVPEPVGEEDIDRGLTADTLTITVGYFGGPYQVKKVFTLEDLYGMELVDQAYTYIDNMPAVVLESAKGVRLTDLLKAAGIDVNSVESFHFYCSDVKNSWYQSINKEYLIDAIRYYYPELPESWDYDSGEAGPGAAAGAEEVETLIALEDNWLRFAAEPDFDNLVKKSRFRLVFGQTDTKTKNAYRSARWIHTIEVMLGGKPPEEETQDTAPQPLAGSELRHDKGLGTETGENTAGVQNWRVYEMSADADELTVPEAENPLLRVISIMTGLIFLVGLTFGMIRFYREV